MVRPGRDRLEGVVEADESYLGSRKPGKPGRGANGKALVLLAVQLLPRDEIGRMRLAPVASMMTPEQYKAQADKIREHWQPVFSGFETMDEMPWRHRQYLIDQMFDGADEQGRPYGIYVREIKSRFSSTRYTGDSPGGTFPERR